MWTSAGRKVKFSRGKRGMRVESLKNVLLRFLVDHATGHACHAVVHNAYTQT